MKNKTQLLLILPSLDGGGAEKVATEVMRHLDRSVFKIKLVLFEKKGEYLHLVPDDVQVVDLQKKGPYSIFNIIGKLKTIITREQPDVLFSMLEYANILTVIASLLVVKRPKVVISERNNHMKYLKHSRFKMLKNILMRWSYRRSDKIIAISEGIKNALIEDFCIDDEKIAVIYNPIDINKVRLLSRENVSWPFENRTGEYYTILSVGRLTEQKNFKMLMRAFAILKSKLPVRLIILGQGELENELKCLAAELNIDGCTHFAGFKNNPYAWMSKADLFVLPSSWEGFGNVIIEAMACGTPVISTDCPSGPSEIIVTGKNGVIVPVDDPHTMHKAILTLLNEPIMRKRLADQATEDLKRFHHQAIVAKYQEVLCSD